MKRKGIFKKTLAVALAAAMTLAMAGCGGKETGAGTADGGSARQPLPAQRRQPEQILRKKGKRLPSA